MRQTVLFGIAFIVGATFLLRLAAVPSPIIAQDSPEVTAPQASPPKPSEQPPLAVGELELAPATTTPKNSAPTPPVPASVPFRVTLVQVRSDWSSQPASTAIKEELLSALKDAAVPSELLDRLPTSGRQILFPPNLVGFYSPANYSQLHAWLKTKELLGTTKEFGDLKVVPSQQSRSPHDDSEPQTVLSDEALDLEISLSQDVNLSDVSNISLVPAQPFVKRQPKQACQVRIGSKGKATTPVSFRVQLLVTEQSRGSDEVVLKAVVDEFRRSFQMPDNAVAIIYVNSGEKSLSSPNPGRFDSLLIVEPLPTGPELAEIKPQLHLPDKVEPATEQSSFDNRSRRSTMPFKSAAMMPSGMMPGSAMPGGKMPQSSSGMLRGMQTGSAKGATQPVPSQQQQVLLSFVFKQLDPAAAADVVKKLFSKSQIDIAVDPRSNQLLVRGGPADLDELKVLFEKLDQPAINKSTGPATKSSLPSQEGASDLVDGSEKISSVALEQLRREYQAAEQLSLDLARTLRTMQRPQQPADQQQLERQLHVAVNAAFIARQQLLQAEVTEFQQRALGIQQSLQLRSRIQDKIVDRRVADLLNPDLDWNAEQRPAAPGSAPQLGLDDSAKSPPPATIDTPTAPTPAQPPIAITSPPVTQRQEAEKPKDIATMDPPRPVAAIAWMEMTFTERSLNSIRPLISAAYKNGVVVTDDGLVACAIGAGSSEAEILEMSNRVTLFIGDNYESVTTETGRVVAYDSGTGLALIQCAHAPNRFLTPDDRVPPVNKQIFLHGKRGKDTVMQASQLVIQESFGVADDPRFQVKCESDESIQGAALVDTANRLQGILSERVPRKRTNPDPIPPPLPPPARTSYQEDNLTLSYAISGQDILALIARYRAQQAKTPAKAAVLNDKSDMSQGEQPKTNEDLAAMGHANPDLTLVMIEALTAVSGQAGEKTVQAKYLNGAVISSDGLIATAWPRDLQEADVLNSIESASISFVSRPSRPVKPVAYEPTYGTLLLLAPAPLLPHLTLSDAPPALQQAVVARKMWRNGGRLVSGPYGLQVVSVSPTLAAPADQYLVGKILDSTAIGTAVLNNAGLLQAILSDDFVPQILLPPDPLRTGENRDKTRIIPSIAIRQLVEKYRTRAPLRSDAKALQLTNPVATPVDPALAGVWELVLPDGKPAPNALQLVFQENHLAIFINGQRTSSWWINNTETGVEPHRISLLVCEGTNSHFGIYEVQGDGLRLNVGSDPDHKLTTFGTPRPEFRRLSTEVPPKLQESMRTIPPPQHQRIKVDSSALSEKIDRQLTLSDPENSARSTLSD